jgi:hypothetical protein
MQTITLPARVRPVNDSDVADGLVGHEARHAALVSCWFNSFAVRVGVGHAYSYCC